MIKFAYDAYAGKKYYFTNKAEALPLLQSFDRAGNVLLFKGSRRAAMEQLMAMAIE